MNLVLKKPLAIIDLETTGIDPATDRIVEIAVLKVSPNGQKTELHQRINPGIPIPESSSEIHGIYEKDVKNEPSFKAFVPKLISFLESCDLAGFNSNRVDIPLLYEEILRAGYDLKMDGRRLIDVQRIFHKMEKRDLSAAYRFYCDKSLENAHNALADVLATFEVLDAQITRYAPELENDMDFLHEFSQSSFKKVDFAGRMIYNAENQEVFNFGKHKGKLVEKVLEDEPYYYDWVMKGTFPLDTKKRLTAIRLRILNNKLKKC